MGAGGFEACVGCRHSRICCRGGRRDTQWKEAEGHGRISGPNNLKNLHAICWDVEHKRRRSQAWVTSRYVDTRNVAIQETPMWSCWISNRTYRCGPREKTKINKTDKQTVNYVFIDLLIWYLMGSYNLWPSVISQHRLFLRPTHCDTCPDFISFWGWVISHCTYLPQLIYPWVCRITGLLTLVHDSAVTMACRYLWTVSASSSLDV